MSRLSKLPLQGRRACIALARGGAYTAEDWARSVHTLGSMYPTIGLTDVAHIVSKTPLDPVGAAQTLVRVANEQAAADMLLAGDLSIDEVARRYPDAKVVAVEPPAPVVGHVKSRVCHATYDDPTLPHVHDCSALEHEFEHRCGVKVDGKICAAAW